MRMFENKGRGLAGASITPGSRSQLAGHGPDDAGAQVDATHRVVTPVCHVQLALPRIQGHAPRIDQRRLPGRAAVAAVPPGAGRAGQRGHGAGPQVHGPDHVIPRVCDVELLRGGVEGEPLRMPKSSLAGRGPIGLRGAAACRSEPAHQGVDEHLVRHARGTRHISGGGCGCEHHLQNQSRDAVFGLLLRPTHLIKGAGAGCDTTCQAA
mmetsp:Transcript_104085/g.261789  ORF Transcript_104085/g.261789 Transcript_104085/m.261789 type:complete len:209 (+) Transcript_104085:1832-2458(+)